MFLNREGWRKGGGGIGDLRWALRQSLNHTKKAPRHGLRCDHGT